MDKENMNQFIAEYGKDIFSFCRQMVFDQRDAEDLYQDTFVVALSKDDVDFRDNPKNYLLTIAVNLWQNRKRKYACRQRIAPTVSMDDTCLLRKAVDDISVEDKVIAGIQKTKVREAVDRLPDKLRLVTVLFYMEDRDIDFISEALAISKGTVKSRLFHARKKLEQELEELLYE